MKLKIEGKEYDLSAALARPTLFQLREMKIRTGYGMKALMEAADAFEGKSPMEIFDDADLLGAFIAMIWLARRQAGEQLTFEQAGSFDLEEMEYIPDEEPEPEPGAELPKAPATDSDPAADAQPAEVPALTT